MPVQTQDMSEDDPRIQVRRLSNSLAKKQEAQLDLQNGRAELSAKKHLLPKLINIVSKCRSVEGNLNLNLLDESSNDDVALILKAILAEVKEADALARNTDHSSETSAETGNNAEGTTTNSSSTSSNHADSVLLQLEKDVAEKYEWICRNSDSLLSLFHEDPRFIPIQDSHPVEGAEEEEEEQLLASSAAANQQTPQLTQSTSEPDHEPTNMASDINNNENFNNSNKKILLTPGRTPANAVNSSNTWGSERKVRTSPLHGSNRLLGSLVTPGTVTTPQHSNSGNNNNMNHTPTMSNSTPLNHGTPYSNSLSNMTATRFHSSGLPKAPWSSTSNNHAFSNNTTQNKILGAFVNNTSSTLPASSSSTPVGTAAPKTVLQGSFIANSSTTSFIATKALEQQGSNIDEDSTYEDDDNDESNISQENEDEENYAEHSKAGRIEINSNDLRNDEGRNKEKSVIVTSPRSNKRAKFTISELSKHIYQATDTFKRLQAMQNGTFIHHTSTNTSLYSQDHLTSATTSTTAVSPLMTATRTSTHTTGVTIPSPTMAYMKKSQLLQAPNFISMPPVVSSFPTLESVARPAGSLSTKQR